MFAKDIYVQRRAELKKRVGEGLILLFGNNDAPSNYPANAYRFRQDSCFLYFFGQKREGLVGVIDIDNDKEYIFGNDIDIDDIIWFGYVPSVSDLAAEVGVGNTAPMAELKNIVDAAKAKGQTIHFVPQCRHDIMIQLADLVGIHPLQSKEKASVKLIKAIVDMSKALDLTVLAEGVETEGQRDILDELGCDVVQGYLYSKPEPAALIERAFLIPELERRTVVK